MTVACSAAGTNTLQCSDGLQLLPPRALPLELFLPPPPPYSGLAVRRPRRPSGYRDGLTQIEASRQWAVVVDTNLRLAGEATLFGGKGRGRWGMGDQVDFLPSTPSVVGCLRALETRVQAMQKSTEASGVWIFKWFFPHGISNTG